MEQKINLPKIHLPRKPIAFLFSCFFVCYGMSNISDVYWLKWVMVAMGFYVEYEAQYLLGLSNSYKESNREYRWLLGVYIGYIIVFGLFSGIGFFATEISVQETAAKKIETIETNNNERIKQLRGLIDSKSKVQAKEYEENNGAGPVYKQMQQEIDSYNAELKELLAGSKTVVTIEKKLQVKDMFSNLSKVTYIPKEILIIIMFGYALSIIYIALTIKPMKVELEPTGEPVNSEPKTPKAQPFALVKGDEIGPEIVNEKPLQITEPPENNSFTDDQKRFISYVDELYRDVDDSKINAPDGGPVKLNSLSSVSERLKGKISARTCKKYQIRLNEWGAIVTNNGLNSLGMWPKADIVQKIRGE